MEREGEGRGFLNIYCCQHKLTMDFIRATFSLKTVMGSCTLLNSSWDHSTAPPIRGALRDRGGLACEVGMGRG